MDTVSPMIRYLIAIGGFMRRAVPFVAVLAIVVSSSVLRGQRPAAADAPIAYDVSFPEPEHHWMQVQVTFSNLPSQPLDARMSRSSPGRYAVAEFAKNVFAVAAFNGRGDALAYTRPDADVWRVAGHDGTVRIVYKIFGDHANGTFFGVDTTHAHLNIPAVFMWATGHENDPMRIRFSVPAGSNWKIATQLLATEDPATFTAPNLQYFMDSPVELADFVTSTFSVPNTDGTQAKFRLVAHSDGSQQDVDELAKLVERLVREQMAVFGEFPQYEPGQYTFLLDYVPWGAGDGMEHRNSTSISNPRGSIKTIEGRQAALGTISHEFFHNWNVERIRPAGLEPFDFTRENVTCCLWVAEGFTQYYGPLLIARAGLAEERSAPVNAALQVINTPGRAVRSPVQMSEYAPFADGAGTFVDATDSSRTFLSYYTYGAGIALALDLSLRELSGGRLSLDDYMRRLWTEHGKPGGPAPGLVAKPYSLRDLRDHLAMLTGRRAFADEFFDKYIEGREAPDYARLLALGGFRLRSADPSKGWIGTVSVNQAPEGLAVGVGGGGRGGGGGRPAPVPFNTPLYAAGIDSGDIITAIDGQPASMAAWAAIAGKKPGEQVTLAVKRRGGTSVSRTVTLAADPTAQQIVPVESEPGGTLTAAQKEFRDAWLASRVK
jgi:predicted metalloprotease with PDZ domain